MANSIISVVLSPAVERYIWVSNLVKATIHRPTRVEVMPGGKGLHAALATHRLGSPSEVIGIVGGRSGRMIQDQCRAMGVAANWIEAGSETRWCVCVIDDNAMEMTEFYEEPSPINDALWRQLTELVIATARQRREPLVMLSGRLPDGVDPRVLGDLVAALEGLGARCLVDTSGEPLRAALKARPFLVKVNADEAEYVSSRQPASSFSPVDALIEAGARSAVVTYGRNGAMARTSSGEHIHVTASPVTNGLAVGSGDCFLAGVASALSDGRSFDEALVRGTAAATINASGPLVAQFLEQDVLALEPCVSLRRMSSGHLEPEAKSGG